MFSRQVKILVFILSSYWVQAQPVSNSLPLFSPSSFELLDLKEQKNIKIVPDRTKFLLFVFLSPECPLSQNYTRTISQLHEKFKEKVNIYGIIPGSAYTIKEVIEFENRYHTLFKIFIDTKLKLTSHLKATVTPEAVLLDPRGYLIYEGAIDNWVQGFGRKKLQPDQHYLKDAIEQILRSEIVKVRKMKAFGCKINDY